jgi:hypothetical protein
MCGPKYCSMKITEEIRQMAAESTLAPGTNADVAVVPLGTTTR